MRKQSISILKARRGSVGRWIKNQKRLKDASTEKRIGKAGHVYVFSLGYDNLYKVGRTTNLLERQKDLQASNPKLRYVWSAYTKDCQDLENLLHRKLKSLLVSREIYRFDDYQDSIKMINDITNRYNERYLPVPEILI